MPRVTFPFNSHFWSLLNQHVRLRRENKATKSSSSNNNNKAMHHYENVIFIFCGLRISLQHLQQKEIGVLFLVTVCSNLRCQFNSQLGAAIFRQRIQRKKTQEAQTYYPSSSDG